MHAANSALAHSYKNLLLPPHLVPGNIKYSASVPRNFAESTDHPTCSGFGAQRNRYLRIGKEFERLVNPPVLLIQLLVQVSLLTLTEDLLATCQVNACSPLVRQIFVRPANFFFCLNYVLDYGRSYPCIAQHIAKGYSVVRDVCTKRVNQTHAI